MIRKLLIAGLAAIPVAILPLAVTGDDTDVYVDNNASAPPSSQPLVMFSIDYRSNLGSTICADARNVSCAASNYFINQGLGSSLPPAGQTLSFFDVLRLSLRVVLRETRGYKAGLMLNHNNENNCAGPRPNNPNNAQRCSNGGYIARGFRSIDSLVPPSGVDSDASRIELLSLIDSLPLPQGNLSHPYQGVELFFEFFRYLTGQGIYNGENGFTDYASSNTQNIGELNKAGTGDNVPVGFDFRDGAGGDAITVVDKAARRYVSPLNAADACSKIFTVNFLFQVSNADNDSNTATNAARTAGGLGITIPSNNTNFSTGIAFLRDADLAPATNKFNSSLAELSGKQNVTSFFIARPTPENSSPPTYDNVTEAYARSGGTDRPLPLSSDPAVLVAALRNILRQILSVSTTLVAASVPVNVFNRAEIVDNVYFALFQAQGALNANSDATQTPGGPAFWPGNMKKLKLEPRNVTNANGDVTGTRPVIVDSLGAEAIAADGRIQLDARTFWTDEAGALLDAGDRNGDGATDSTDNDADGIGNVFTAPYAGTAANPQGYVTDRDGRFIARGAAGQKIPGFISGSTGPGDVNPAGVPSASGPRKLFYLNTAGGGLQPLESSLTSAEIKTQLGSAGMSNSQAANLLKYARGQDVADTDGDSNTAEARYWILGDPLHSRPLPLNYGAITVGTGADAQTYTTTNPAIYIAMASNDGYLRMFRNTTGAGAQSGQEVWAFMPPEGMAIQSRLLNNTGVPQHPYSFDGEPTALIIDQDGDGNIEAGDRVVLYIGLRRGGSAYYALDVTDPVNPVFLWRITPSGVTTPNGFDASTAGNFTELGQSFSRPRVGLVNLGVNPDGSAVRRLAVFFGGGYDGGYTGTVDGDGNPVRLANDIDGAMADDARGNALFIVRANNAQLLWKAVKGNGGANNTTFQHPDLDDSIPSNLTTVDSNADGAVDRLYVGDAGGNLWRADLGPDTDATPNGPTDDWKLTRLACLGRHSGSAAGSGCTDAGGRINDRRFFHEPDVIQSRDAEGRFDAVVIGSGDREDPLDQGGDVDNSFYVIKDRNTDIGSSLTDSTRNHFDLTDATHRCIAGGATCTIGGEGWRLQLDNGPNGEKALSAPVTIANSIFFTTYVPPPPFVLGQPVTSCGPKEGTGFLYSLKLATGASARDYNVTDGTANPDGSGTTDDDRDKELDSIGIPAQVVYLGSPSNTEGGGACVVNILAGAQIFEAPGCPRFRTFWQRHGS